MRYTFCSPEKGKSVKDRKTDKGKKKELTGREGEGDTVRERKGRRERKEPGMDRERKQI